MDNDKEKIIQLFNQNVRGLKATTTNINQKHDGAKGHRLETQMGISHNNNNKADLLGYEMKTGTSSGKISFGDWAADYYIFDNEDFFDVSETRIVRRDQFIKVFGKFNQTKNRYSWSGEVCPTYYNRRTNSGQMINISPTNDVLIEYNHSEDFRNDNEIPSYFQKDNLILAKWDAKSLKKKVEKKFNQKGWFKCFINEEGQYTSIGFENPITFEIWIKLLKEGKIFFDSGMYADPNKPNQRFYSQWRAITKVWDDLIKETY
ncbi:MAG: LlaMI family restriction endonuclease [Halothece sp. Uz-M2-17]|nr:LlaMI family restriction endonuclease [Halothece sp. Uz-M2-17]